MYRCALFACPELMLLIVYIRVPFPIPSDVPDFHLFLVIGNSRSFHTFTASHSSPVGSVDEGRSTQVAGEPLLFRMFLERIYRQIINARHFLDVLCDYVISLYIIFIVRFAFAVLCYAYIRQLIMLIILAFIVFKFRTTYEYSTFIVADKN